jgi:hypothetical protein
MIRLAALAARTSAALAVVGLTTFIDVGPLGAQSSERELSIPTPSGPLPPALTSARWSFTSTSDMNELANELADAYTDLGVCFGWKVVVNGVISTEGSNFGPATAFDPVACDDFWMRLVVDLTYTDESSETEDSGRFFYEIGRAAGAESNLAPQGLVIRAERSTGMGIDNLLGANDDEALVRLTLAMPLIYAEQLGRTNDAEVVTALPSTEPPNGRVSIDVGHDRWRRTLPLLGIAAVAGTCLGVVVGWISGRLTSDGFASFGQGN